MPKHTLANSEIYTDSVPEKCTEKSNRPKRQIKKPVRYRDENYVNPDEKDSSNDNQIKAKRILAKRKDDAYFNYSIQLYGYHYRGCR